MAFDANKFYETLLERSSKKFPVRSPNDLILNSRAEGLKAALMDPRVQEAIQKLPSVIDPYSLILAHFDPYSRRNPYVASTPERLFNVGVVKADDLLNLLNNVYNTPSTSAQPYLIQSKYDPNAQYKVTSWQEALDRNILITDPNVQRALTQKLAETPYYKQNPDKLAADVQQAQAQILLNSKNDLLGYGVSQVFNPLTGKLGAPATLKDILLDLEIGAQQHLRDLTAKAGFADIVNSLTPLPNVNQLKQQQLLMPTTAAPATAAPATAAPATAAPIATTPTTAAINQFTQQPTAQPVQNSMNPYMMNPYMMNPYMMNPYMASFMYANMFRPTATQTTPLSNVVNTPNTAQQQQAVSATPNIAQRNIPFMGIPFMGMPFMGMPFMPLYSALMQQNRNLS